MTPKDIIDAKIGEKKPKETSEEELSNDTNQENIVENNEVTNQDENIVDNNQLSIGKKNTNNAVEETEKEDENEPKITLEETN
jgi:hypothetical protein